MKTLPKIASLLLPVFIFMAGTAVAGIADNNQRSDAWEIDRSHSAINFSINHFFTPVDGAFDDYNAEVLFDPNDLEGSSISVTIPIESINTRNDRRDNHLMSEDFFNAEQWPNLTFESNTIEQTGDNQFVAKGQLTIRDVSRDFELPFELLGVMDHPMQEGKKVAGIVADAELMRTDFGVGVGDWAATAVVGDKVDIEINLELTADR